MIFALILSTSLVVAQASPLQQKVAAIEAAAYKNKQMLGEYTWQQQETVLVNGEVKKVDLYQVQLGPNGKPAKVEINQSSSTPDRRKFGIRHRIAQNYIDYGKQVAALAASYTQPQPGRLKALYAQGQVSLRSAGAPGLDAVVVHGYVKPGDTVTFTFDRAAKSLVAIQVASYLGGPSDVVTIEARFAKLADGTSHVSTATVNGQSKNLTVQDVNMNYRKRAP
ncbi:MAG TPA: hypothetical protein VMV65_05760 [Alphaproteobacteria bacterium]|nr:hypothetical protein [Alphaproteobacteria bacterium]